MRTEQIRALTGLRFFAALWVVAYHVGRANGDVLQRNYPNALPMVEPILNRGLLGVDLFFVLSGFVLTLNYLDQLGPRLDPSKAARFLWLRLARVWPTYVVTLLLAGSLIVVRHSLWDSAPTGRLNAPRFFAQLFMVQTWFAPHPGQVSWAGPAWTLSAEWLAYLAFPALAPLALRLHAMLQARRLLVGALVVQVPLVILLFADGGFTGDYSWLMRIACEFTAGVLLCAGVARLRLSSRQRRVAGWGAVLCLVLLVAALYVIARVRGPFTGNHTLLLFTPLIGCLAIGRGWLVALLSTRALQVGGGLSYALYLLHSPLLHLFRDVTQYSRFHLAPLPRFFAELAFVPVIVVIAYLVFARVEEPSRRLMRRMLEHRFPWVEDQLVPTDGTNPHADHPLVPRAPARSVGEPVVPVGR